MYTIEFNNRKTKYKKENQSKLDIDCYFVTDANEPIHDTVENFLLISIDEDIEYFEDIPVHPLVEMYAANTIQMCFGVLHEFGHVQLDLDTLIVSSRIDKEVHNHLIIRLE